MCIILYIYDFLVHTSEHIDCVLEYQVPSPDHHYNSDLFNNEAH